MSSSDLPAEGGAASTGDASASTDPSTTPAVRSEGPRTGPVASLASALAAEIAAKSVEADAAPAGDVANAAKSAAGDAPSIEVESATSEDAAGDVPVIELGVDAVDLPVPGAAAPPDAIPSAPVVPSFMTAGASGTSAGPSFSPVTPEAEKGRYRPSHWFLGITAFLVTAADLGTKEWAKLALAGPELKRAGKHVEVVRDHMDFIFAQNPGGAWSFLRGVPDGIRRPFFLFVSAAAIVFIVTVYSRLEKRQWAMRWGLPLALGGAIGNLADRVRYGWVVDFVDVYYKGGANEVHWPTFNVADIAIVVGVGLMALDLLSLRRPKAPPAPAADIEAASGAA